MEMGKERVRPSVFADDVILYIENRKEFTVTHTQTQTKIFLETIN